MIFCLVKQNILDIFRVLEERFHILIESGVKI
uniref:Uncharacterized protein n=1 Tax=Anguilla anguilla TaxID=7936 RepID=A0A0E9R1C5_ANGAN